MEFDLVSLNVFGNTLVISRVVFRRRKSGLRIELPSCQYGGSAVVVTIAMLI